MTHVRCSALIECMCVGLIVTFGGVLPQAFAQKDHGPPLVAAASLPLYPRTALLAHIQGTVKIRVTTDGTKISSLDAESGPPMLVQAAEDNIRTWQFEDHKPTTFFVTFQYRIEEPAQCSVGNPTVLLHLPSDIQISAKGVHTCDPASVERNNKGK